MLAIAVFWRRGLLSGTVEQILTKATTYPNRQILIGTLADADEPVLLHLTRSASYNKSFKAASTANIRYAVNTIGNRTGLETLGVHGPRRGAAQDANRLDRDHDEWRAGTSLQVSAALGHPKLTARRRLGQVR